MSEITSTQKYEAEYFELIKKRRTYSAILLGVFIVLMISGFNVVDDRNAGSFWAGITSIFDFPREVILEASEKIEKIPGLFVKFFPSLIETINIAAAATLAASIFAIFLSMLATQGMAKWPRLIPVFRRILDIMRAIPDFVIALILIFILGGGPVPAMIAITFHTTGALGKLFSEVNENASLQPLDGLSSVGASWMQKMLLGILPQVSPNYFSYALLRFEIIIRISAILGFVGAGGIGYDLKNAISWGKGRYDEAGAIFILLFVTIVIVDQLSGIFRDRLTHGKKSEGLL